MKMVWVIRIRLPNGDQMLFAEYNKQFALVPVKEGGVVRSASGWDTHIEAEGYLRSLLKLNPQIKKMAPFEILRIPGSITPGGTSGDQTPDFKS